MECVTDHSVYPDCLLYVGLLAEVENWEAVEKLSRSIMQIQPSSTCDGWIARAVLEINPESFEKLNNLGALPNPEFAVENLKLAFFSGNNEKIDKLLSLYEANTEIGIILRLVNVLLSKESVSQEHVELAEQLSKESSRELVLAAEIRLRAGLDANTLLVKAAKLNVRCSRAFFLLGNSIAKKNLTKAKSLLERTIQIRPGNEEYTRALYEVLSMKNASAEARVEVLKSFMSTRRSRQKPFWLADALST